MGGYSGHDQESRILKEFWIPAFAGMTGQVIFARASLKSKFARRTSFSLFFLANGPIGNNFNFKGQRKGKSCPNPGLPLHNTLNFKNYLNFPERHIFC